MVVYGPATVEENAARIEGLEKEWATLGDARTVTFSCRFDGEERAREFAKAAEGYGVRVSISQDGCCHSVFYAYVTLELEPIADLITEWEHKLYGLLVDDDSHYDGWRYPQRLSINFYPNCARSNESAARSRAAVLFGTRLVKDPMAKFNLFGPPPPEPFKLVPSVFLRKARRLKPANPKPTASAFAQWVYSLYGEAYGDDEDLKEGHAAEEEIWKRRAEAYGSNGNDFLERVGSPWQLIHNGLHLRHGETPRFYEIDNLRLGGQALKASPDLIYRNCLDGHLVIPEIKHSHVKLPPNLWPNIWAQLWCYSQIDLVRKASGVTVVGEIWSETWSKGYGRGRSRVGGQKLVSLRASVRRDPRDPKFDRFFRSLFEIYSGEQPN